MESVVRRKHRKYKGIVSQSRKKNQNLFKAGLVSHFRETFIQRRKYQVVPLILL